MTYRQGYPPNWPQIAARIKEAAGWKCRHCTHAHDPRTGHTLTVHHLDGDPSNCAPENLVALCQRCHLHLQARYQPGQALLPGMDHPAWMENRQRKLDKEGDLTCKEPLDSV